VISKKWLPLGIDISQKPIDPLGLESNIKNEDSSMLANDLGGIDLNPNNLNLQTQGNEINIDFLFDPDQMLNINIDGFLPVIINITPITNLPLLLGELETEEQQELSLLP